MRSTNMRFLITRWANIIITLLYQLRVQRQQSLYGGHIFTRDGDMQFVPILAHNIVGHQLTYIDVDVDVVVAVNGFHL
jgi:hypothetical protein